MRHAAIMTHYGEVTETEQRVLIDLGVRLAVITSAVYDTLRNKMAAEHQHGSHLLISTKCSTFTCCARMFGKKLALRSNTITTGLHH